MMVHITLIPALRRRRRVDSAELEFEIYMSISRIDSVSKTKSKDNRV